MLGISRLAQTYMPGDGKGRLISEAPAPRCAVEAARATRQPLDGRTACAGVLRDRLTIEEKLEPIFGVAGIAGAGCVPRVAALV